MSLLTKDAIFGASDIVSEDVPVPEWGGSVRVCVMSGLARDVFVSGGGKSDAGFSDFQARLLVATAVDAAGDRIFEPADVERLQAKSRTVLDRLTAAAMRLNGIGHQAQEDIAKNSDAALSGDTGSASPSISESPSGDSSKS
ncbi:hypothetical protein AB4156_16395 [Cupriavidus sp. 2MCAB6]|uniref:hypothetical protein n=1 Tax=Cupriavidus sp. 2MCAB6 TaxID=3232981 RepID=UPI003F8E0D08